MALPVLMIAYILLIFISAPGLYYLVVFLDLAVFTGLTLYDFKHIEYAYEPDELALWLEEAGFTHIRQYGDRVLRAPKQDEQRIYFSAKKD